MVNKLIKYRYSLPILVLCCITHIGYSQTYSIERQVIGATGNFSEGSISGNPVMVTSTVGEALVSTANSGSVYFTQGFNQPNTMLLEELSFFDTPTQSICPDVENGTIEVNNITGCLPPYTVRLRKSEGNSFVTVDSLSYNQQMDRLIFTNLGIDTFIVEVLGATFCVKSDTFFLDAKNPESCGLKIYSGLTPNGDGANDFWLIDNIEINAPNEVAIFNRWGNLVWDAKGYDNDVVVWKGENKNGKALPDATYFYVIKTPGKTYDGWVEITR
jgi:gliding motility-associated-like protein